MGLLVGDTRMENFRNDKLFWDSLKLFPRYTLEHPISF